MEREFYVIAFESTHHAIMMEKKLKEKYDIDMIPTPREITASCGLSIKFSSQLLDNILEELENENMKEKMHLYRIERIDHGKRAEKVKWEEN